MSDMSFEQKNNIEEELFYSSAWLTYIGTGPVLADGNRIVVVMYYAPAGGWKTGNNGVHFFYATDGQYQDLIDGGGSVYWNVWSTYGSKSVEYYNNQEPEATPEKTSGAVNEVNGGLDSGEIEELLGAKKTGDDEFNNVLKEIVGDDEDKKEIANKIFKNVETIEDLFNRTLEIRQTIQQEGLTGVKAFQKMFRDTEGFFGISIEKKLKQAVIGNISSGKLSPQDFVKYKYKMKQMYDLIEKDGIQGAAEIGRRFVNAKNPLIRNRTTYKAKEGLKDINRIRKAGHQQFFTGDEAVKEVVKFHKQTLKASKEGIIKKNASELVLTESGYTWRKTGKIAGTTPKVSAILSAGKKIPVVGKVFRVINIGLTLFTFTSGKSKKDKGNKK